MSTPACLVHLGGPPETASSARAAWQSRSPGKGLRAGASYCSCKQASPGSTSAPRRRPRRPPGPRPCPGPGPSRPGSPHSRAVWGPRWDSAFPSFRSTRCHWLREGVRGGFSGSCTSRPEGEARLSSGPRPRGLPPGPAHSPSVPSAPPAPRLHPAWNAAPHWQLGPCSPPVCAPTSPLPRPPRAPN